ncbi:DUF6030 family protein [Stappia sp.]|uniref:DUF6030 family protein n=1 Tax=Stappia sp. TaxID=1870903 RepID=UPI003D1065BA
MSILAGVGLALATAAALGWIVSTPPAPPLETAPPPAALPADPLAGIAGDTLDRLLLERLDRPAVFKRVFGGHPRDLCAAIDRLGIPMAEWKPDPFVAGFWYCASDLVTIGRTAEDGRRSSLFVNLRGQGEATLNTVRIKLNGDNPASAPAARAALLRVLDAVGERYGWPWPGEVRTAIEENRPAEVVQYGMVSRVVPEDPELTGDAADVVRLNVIVDFPVVDLVAPAELFAPFAWEEEAPSARRRNRPVGGDTLRAPASGDIIFSTPD